MTNAHRSTEDNGNKELIAAETEDATKYSVGPTPPAPPPTAPTVTAVSPTKAAPRKVAVFVAHGMGQQIPFETLDSIAEALRRRDLTMPGSRKIPPHSNSVRCDDKWWLQRVELQLKSGEKAVEAHVYEAYWAPLTEGRINARNVMGFLAGGGSNGLKIARGKFRRWVLGQYHHFPTPFRSILYLLIALATVGALLILNSTIGFVAAARALLGQSPAWLTPGLYADLTTTFNIVVTAMGIFGMSLAISHYMRRTGVPRFARLGWGWVTIAEFTATLFIIVFAGLAVVLLFYSHVRGGLAASAEVWSSIFPGQNIPRFNLRFGFWALWVVLVFSGLRLLWWLGELLVGFIRDLIQPKGRLINISLTILITVVFGVLVASLFWLLDKFIHLFQGADGTGLNALKDGLVSPLKLVVILWLLDVALLGFGRHAKPRQNWTVTTKRITLFLRRSSGVLATIVAVPLVVAVSWLVYGLLHNAQTVGGPGFETLQRGAAWPLLIVMSAFIRLVLVQYVGDVAIYVMPYKLDAFNDLRKEIKDLVYKVANAVYAMKSKSQGNLEYNQIIVVGHSLGSVIAYDALNRLIHEDRESGNALDVVNRTPLFLTFGCPLDKTAFIFGAQGHGTTEARESLAASVQPLIQDYKYRPEQWINIYSPWDIISGHLDLYDLPPATDEKAVKNLSDPQATTLLMAHTEYWTGDLLVETLYNAL